MLEQLVGQKVVIDTSSLYVCLGTLEGFDELYLRLRDADVHDLRDTGTTRENYVAAARDTGIKRNRKVVLIVRREVVALSRLEDVVDE